MDSLPIFVRLAGQRVLLLGEGDAADAKARLIMAAGGIVVRETGAGVRLAFVALDDEAAAAAAADRLKALGMLVNVVDRPALCDFTVPAIVDRSPVLLAIGTGGASATLAKALRERLEALLPARLGTLALAIRAARRAVSTRHPDSAGRRALWDAALAPGGRLDPLREHAEPAAVIGELLQSEQSLTAASLTQIALTSADPDDLTLRQLRLLAQADTLYCGPDVPPAVLDRARRDAVRLPAPPPETLPAGRSIWLR